MTAPTPSQTIGPFFSFAMTWLAGDDAGDVDVHGRVLDGDGAPVDDAMLELWSPGCFRRAMTDGDGCWSVRVERAPIVDVSVFARGLLQRVVTRIYFTDDVDDVLAAVDPGRRGTLMAEPDDDGFRFDIHLQGERETVFFAW